MTSSSPGEDGRKLSSSDIEVTISRAWSAADREFLLEDSIESESPSGRAVVGGRLISLVVAAWNRVVTAHGAARPDVLSITSQLLTRPDAPHEQTISRFSIVLALRGIYGIEHSTESIVALRRAYDEIRAGFSRKKRRELKRASSAWRLLVDVLCMEGWVRRSLRPRENLEAYYSAFHRHPFGVTPQARREFVLQGSDTHWPELHGEIPDFGVLIQILFNQPTGVRGLDEVLGGLIPTVMDGPGKRFGGLVTLITGPPGSGKTTLCLSIASRMASLGAFVRYVAAEEATSDLRVKLATFDASSDRAEPDLLKLVENDFESFSELADTLSRDSDGAGIVVPEPDTTSGPPLFLCFPRVVVIDSLSAVFRPSQGRGIAGSGDRTTPTRGDLARALETLRSIGMCVFLVGGENERAVSGIDYLVDNVLSLSVEESAGRRAAQRILVVEKTRHQVSNRGGHILQLSAADGCVIMPSLESVIRSIDTQKTTGSDVDSRAVVLMGTPALAPEQQELFPMGDDPTTPLQRVPFVTVRSRSQTLVYGAGASGKARFGVHVALEPRVPWSSPSEVARYLSVWQQRNRDLEPIEIKARDSSRLLVLSFLYDSEYYESIGRAYFRQRFRMPTAEAERRAGQAIDVVALRPGFVNAETVVGQVRHKLERARLEGRPFTAVLLDGVHNILVDFPALQHEPLLWATLYRVLRAAGVEAVTTFTFFELAGGMMLRQQGSSGRDGERTEGSTVVVGDREHLFFHLLVSSCDHTFVLRRDESREGRKVERVSAELHSSVDMSECAETIFGWSGQSFAPSNSPDSKSPSGERRPWS